MMHLHKSRMLIYVLVGLSVVLALAFPVTADPEVTTSDINPGMVGENDFMAGYVIIPRIPIFWQSDEPWRLTVNSLDPDMEPGYDARHIKPVEDVLWRVSETDEWLPISINSEEIAWSDDTGSGVVYIDIIVLLDWLTDSPGDYRIDLEFSIESIQVESSFSQ